MTVETQGDLRSPSVAEVVPPAEVAPSPQPLSPEPLPADPTTVESAAPASAVVEPALETPAPMPVAEPEPVPAPVAFAEPVPTPELVIPVAEPAPLVQAQPSAVAAPATPPAADTANQVLGLPLQLVNQLLAKLGAAPLQSLADLWPALRLVSLLLAAGVAVKLTAATLGAINDIPLMGRLLELVGLISALNFLARNAVKSQKRAELLARITKLKHDLLG